MAQKFSDWYYAISTIRVPGQEGRPPMEAACQAFAQGIVTVTRPRALVDWAHDLLERELKSVGYGLDTNKPTGSDHPNAMTRNRSPRELIENVAESIDPAQRRVLALAYDPSINLTVVDQAADELGGTPFAMLQARYALKQRLQQTQDVPFAVVPENADMDRGPISLYEAHRLASGQEICELEKWLLSDIDLCKDIAEFSAFVHALRGGALQAYAIPLDTPTPVVETAEVAEPAPEIEPPVAAPPEPTEPSAEIPDAGAETPAVPEATVEPEPEPETQQDVADEAAPPADTPAPPETQPEAPPAKGSSLRAFLITSATLVLAVILILMIIILVLREA